MHMITRLPLVKYRTDQVTMAGTLLLVITLVALGAGHGDAFDPNPLQDFCVADTTSKVRVNGLPCKDPAAVVPDDFFFAGADKPGGTTSRRYGFSTASVQIPGLNTLGASHVRVDVSPGAVFPPHYHPRASETAVVLEGSVYFGFVTSYPDNKLFAKVLRKGNVFAVPQGLVHFLYNNGSAPAALYATLSSQNPGLVLVGDALFAAAVPDDLLARTLLARTLPWRSAAISISRICPLPRIHHTLVPLRLPG